jgi:hypothetical protein
MVDRVRESGGSQQAIDQMAERAQLLKRLYDQPLTNAALTFVEPLPIGIVVAAIAAAILRKC